MKCGVSRWTIGIKLFVFFVEKDGIWSFFYNVELE